MRILSLPSPFQEPTLLMYHIGVSVVCCPCFFLEGGCHLQCVLQLITVDCELVCRKMGRCYAVIE